MALSLAHSGGTASVGLCLALDGCEWRRMGRSARVGNNVLDPDPNSVSQTASLVSPLAQHGMIIGVKALSEVLRSTSL